MYLTHPVLLLYEEDIPKNKTSRNYFHQLEEYARAYKEALVDQLAWESLAEKLKSLLNLLVSLNTFFRSFWFLLQTQVVPYMAHYVMQD